MTLVTEHLTLTGPRAWLLNQALVISPLAISTSMKGLPFKFLDLGHALRGRWTRCTRLIWPQKAMAIGHISPWVGTEGKLRLL